VRLTWVLESSVFADGHAALKDAVAAAGHRVIEWQDDWWAERRWPELGDVAVVFHGSLGNAARIARELPWRPGSFCDEEAFECSAWYPRVVRWLANHRYEFMAANELAADPEWAFEEVGNPAAIFVRPDSPLKPFAGRVLGRERVTLAALDHGFYYDDPALPVVVAPARAIGREWRYVVVDCRVVAGSAYEAAGREARPETPTGAAWDFAARVARLLLPPERVYVMDVCECDGELCVLELNPFSGADLYACNATDVVAAVSAAALEMKASEPPRSASRESPALPPPSATYEIDGRRFSTLEGFFEEIDRVLIKEAFWGHNLNAFNDILRGGFGTPEGGFTLVWSHHEVSRERLGHAETARGWEQGLAAATDPDWRRRMGHALRLARAGAGPTIFDDLVRIILEHSPGGREERGNVILVLR
jgi:hypothetical protein